MLKRIISGLIGVVILFGVYFSKSNVVFNIAATLISIIGLNEYYNAIRKKGIKPIELPGYICCILLLGVGFVNNDKILIPAIFMLMPILFFIFFSISIFTNMKYKFTDIAASILGIIYVPIMMLFLILTWQIKNCYVWYIFCGAWLTDTFAYFVGSAIGKHKFSKISPNKSIEGCVGGFYTYFLNKYRLVEIGGKELNVVLMVVFGVIISIISQIGDLIASSIKRQCEIKDYGKIMPGHGGILDRFDSILMISPFVYIIFEFIL